jgi:cytochrome P450
VTVPPTIELSEAFLRDPGPVYEQLRSRGSVHHVRFPTGLTGWLVTDYNLAKQVLGDPTIRKDVHHFRRIVDTAHPGLNLPGALRSDMASHMLNTDPPDHTRLRRLVAQAFTPRSVTALEPRIAQIAEDLLAGMPTQGPVDLLAEFAFPLPITVILRASRRPRRGP